MSGASPAPTLDGARFWQRHAVLVGAGCSVAILLLVLMTLPVRYNSNDDLGMLLRLTDWSGFQGDPHQLYLSYPAGLTFRFLYGLSMDVPWFGLYVYFIDVLGLTLTLSVLLRANRGWAVLLALPLLVVVYLQAFAFSSFTTATLLVQLGVYLAAAEWLVRGACPVRRPRCYFAFLCVVLLAGLFLRFKPSSLLAAPPLLLFLRREQVRAVLLAVAIVGGVLVVDNLLLRYATSEAHREYIEYNRLRGVFCDSPLGDDYGEVTARAAAAAGWTYADYHFFQSWILFDNEKFNPDTLRTFLQANVPSAGESALAAVEAKVRREYQRRAYWILVFLAAFGSLLIYGAPRVLRYPRGLRLRVVLVVGFLLGMLGFLLWFRFVPRVFVPLFLYAFGWTFLLSQLDAPAGRRRSPGRLVVTAVTVGLSLLAWERAHAYGEKAVAVLASSRAQLDWLQKWVGVFKQVPGIGNPYLLNMSPGGGLRKQYSHPLKEFSDFLDVRLISGGWGINSPAYQNMLRSLGLADGRAFLRWLVDNPEVFLFQVVAHDPDFVSRRVDEWLGYYERNIYPGRRLRMVPGPDFRDPSGRGLVFFRLRLEP